MRFTNRWSIALCSGLVFLTACDNSVAPLTTMPESPSAALAAAPAGLLAFYSFDEDAGDGAVSGATHVASGGYQGSGAFEFDGDGDYIDLPINVNPSVRPRVTMGAWMRVTSLPFNRSAQILSHDNGGWDRSLVLDQRGLNRWMPMDGQHRVAAFMGDGVVPGPVVDTARWTFVAAVYDESSVTLYVDGVRYNQPAWNTDGFSILRVGGSPGALLHGEAFHGTIDNVFVYDRALTDNEIETIRTGGACAITGTCVQPRRVAFYPFDNSVGEFQVAGAVHEPAGGYQGGAYYFDGSGAHIDLPVDVNRTAMPRMTMGAWMRVASLPVGVMAQVLSADNGGFDRSIGLDLRQTNGWSLVDGRYRVSAFTGSGVLPGTVPSMNAWTFVAAVYDETTVTLYVDGVRYETTARGSEGVSFLRVGGNPAGSDSGEPFHGWIDNVFVVNEALSSGEIEHIRAEGACVLAGTPCNVAPAVDVGGPYRGGEGSPVALALSASDADGDALSLEWDLGDGTKGTGAVPTEHTYADNGTYTVQLTATDPSGLSATASATVQVSNVSPEVAPFAGAALVQGERYTASVSFSDPGADGWTATVSYGDGSPEQPLALNGMSAVLAHDYAVPGTYTVRVSVRDDDGDITPGTATATVTVVSLRDAIPTLVGLIPEVTSKTERNAARQLGHQLTSAGNFIASADDAKQPATQRAHLNNVLTDLNDALQLLTQLPSAPAALREEILRIRALVQARHDAI